MKKATNEELYEAQGEKCFYCGCYMRFIKGQSADKYTEDHFHPRCNGNGKNGNIVLACYPCNQKKDDREPTPKECAKKKALYEQVKKIRRKKNCIRGSKWQLTA